MTYKLERSRGVTAEVLVRMSKLGQSPITLRHGFWGGGVGYLEDGIEVDVGLEGSHDALMTEMAASSYGKVGGSRVHAEHDD